ncbi:MAG: hypothetical protein KJO61_14375 [Deltaproteobacteria bacterium]|nr:hypothetical protein [Deltaproteobacteria bacterium]
MELIIELILWFIIEVVFWGFMFWTGYFLILIISIGQWKPGPVRRDKEKRKEKKFIATAVIGAVFWIGFGIALIIATGNP